MDFSNDELRRATRETQVEHDETMRSMRRFFGRVFSGESDVSDLAKHDLVTGGLARRRFLQIGGLSVASAAVIAACSSDKKTGSTTTLPSSTSAATTTTAGKADAKNDITILRTASSIEALAVAAYQTAIDSGLVTTAAIGDAAKLFQSQHREHLAFFVGLTEKLGGTAFKDPNPAILAQLQPTIKALKTETGVVTLAYNLELAAAQTYQSDVGNFTSDMTLNQAVMTVGGVEARHAAVLAGVLKKAPVPKAFQVTDGAVPAGTGV